MQVRHIQRNLRHRIINITRVSSLTGQSGRLIIFMFAGSMPASCINKVNGFMRDFCIVIPPKIWYEGDNHKALMAVLEKFGPYYVDQITSMPHIRLWPAGSSLKDKLPHKKWVCKDGEIQFMEIKGSSLHWEILK